MAINPNTNATMSGRVTAVSAAYPFASAKDESSPGAGDGTPYFLGRADDIFGLQQALLNAASIVPSGNADTVLVSQYLEALGEIAAGRATAYDESGVADAYVLDVRAKQHGPQSYFDNLTAFFKPGNVNTGASTADIAGLGVKNIKTFLGADPAAGVLPAGVLVQLRYDLATDTLKLPEIATVPDASETVKGKVELATQAETDAGTDDVRAVTPLKLNKSPQTAAVWVNFDASGVVTIRDSFNVTSVSDNGTGDFTINFTVNMANINYVAVSSGQSDIAGGNFAAGDAITGARRTADSHAVGNYKTSCVDSASALLDPESYELVIFGDQ